MPKRPKESLVDYIRIKMNNKKQIKERLDNVSCSFCLAKWKQVTLHLQNGHNHSCHHPDTHLIPLEEIKADPSALHNTSFKKNIRHQMLNNEKPPECSYCWKVEDTAEKQNKEIFSDRVNKSNDPWAEPYFNECVDAGAVENINPSYVEVSFSNVCNLKCAYCAPHISSSWMEEVRQFGGYPTSINFNNLEHIKQSNKMPFLNSEENPYVEAFWKWWPNLYNEMDTFRITGGEPLLTKNTFKVLDWIIEHPQPKLNLEINSNLAIPDKNLNNFIARAKIIQQKKQINNFRLYTSAEAFQNKAEYIRTGLDYNKWLENCNKFLTEIPNSNLGVMATYNLLSITSFERFLEDILELKKQYGAYRLTIDIPHLCNPRFLSIEIAPNEYIEYIDRQLKFMQSNKLFSDFETEKMERVKTLFESSTIKNIVDRKDFVLYVDEYDRRRNTNFLETFPEMKEFYDSIDLN